MVSLIRHFRQDSKLEAVGWIVGGACMAGLGIWIYNRHFGGYKRLEDWEAALKKELGFDAIKINKTLRFGTQLRTCSAHHEETDGTGEDPLCEDLECRFGPIGYLVKTLSGAQKSIDVAIYLFSCQYLGGAILEMHRRGVSVRVVADAASLCKGSSLNSLIEAGVPVRTRVCTPYHMHHKFIVIDGEIVVNGSMNFTITGVNANWENAIVTSEPGIVRPFVNEFQTLWEDFEQGKEIILEGIPKHARTLSRHQKPV